MIALQGRYLISVLQLKRPGLGRAGSQSLVLSPPPPPPSSRLPRPKAHGLSTTPCCTPRWRLLHMVIASSVKTKVLRKFPLFLTYQRRKCIHNSSEHFGCLQSKNIKPSQDLPKAEREKSRQGMQQTLKLEILNLGSKNGLTRSHEYYELYSKPCLSHIFLGTRQIL